ncbi:MAG: hypothetical protein KDJ67_16355 [Nitratireductor sp.]|nr:hypothetical protein [Nitratireductor sp.]
MKSLIKLLFAVVLLGSAQISHAASFDCAKAKSRTEKIICLDKNLSALDSQLGLLVKKSRSRAETLEWTGDSPASTPKAWLASWLENEWKWREKNCEDAVCLHLWFAKQVALHHWLSEADDAFGDTGMIDVIQLRDGSTYISYEMSTHVRNIRYLVNSAVPDILPDGDISIISEEPLSFRFEWQKSYFKEGGAFWYDTLRDSNLAITGIFLDPDSTGNKCWSKQAFLDATNFESSSLDKVGGEDICPRR